MKKWTYIFAIIMLTVAVFLTWNWSLKSVSDQTIESENQEIQKRLNSDDQLVCILEIEKRTYKLGEIPELRVYIKNNSAETIFLLQPGFIEKRIVQDNIILDRPINFKKVIYFCPMSGPIDESMLIRLEPNEKYYPLGQEYTTYHYSIENSDFNLPGTYQLHYWYNIDASLSTVDEEIERIRLRHNEILNFNGFVNQDIVGLNEKLRQLRPIDISSNKMTVKYSF